jgi:hypothetical protein
MPIIMQFAGDHIGASYRDYATDFRVLTEGQTRVAEEFGIDHVNTMSDPAGEAADCGAAVKFFPNQPPALDEVNALLTDKTRLATLEVPPGSACIIACKRWRCTRNAWVGKS